MSTSDDKTRGGGFGSLFGFLFRIEAQAELQEAPLEPEPEVHLHFYDDGAPCDCDRCKRGIPPGPDEIHVNGRTLNPRERALAEELQKADPADRPAIRDKFREIEESEERTKIDTRWRIN